MDRLRDNHSSSMNGPLLDAPISLIVQGFYCHRIWALNKRRWWLRVIIAIVCVFPFVV